MSEQTVTMEQAVESFKRGEKVLLCEYRFGKGERIKYRDKVTQKAAEFATIRHTVEVGDSSFIVGERAPENFDENAYKSPIAKGTKCLLRYERFTVTSGVGQFSGTLVPVVDRPGRPA